ncbi:MAG: T9SS type A sorting domain-containing protein [Candidatus Krumholzibacteriota bacterium]|nr:T9SS type A sorting domain-containing protein [Candidatus Krumholzibacteriota bacterium]
MFLSGCCASGLNESRIAQEPRAREPAKQPREYRYRVLRDEGSIRIEWVIAAPESGAVFSVQRLSSYGRKFVELDEVQAGAGEIDFRFCDSVCCPGMTYRYRVECRGATGSARVLFETGAYEAPGCSTALCRNCPNPFTGATVLRFSLAERGRVAVAVYDARGRRVCVLVDAVMARGPHNLAWDGRDDTGRAVAAGVYFCRLRAGEATRSGKLVVMR